MTLEELKTETNKLGYNLIKKKSYIPIKPCPLCGKKSTNVWYGQRGVGTQRRCSFCGFKGDWTNEKISVNKAWNNAVEKCVRIMDEARRTGIKIPTLTTI